MSAISGIFHRDGRSSEISQIKKMNYSMSHRGPNHSGVWNRGSVAFGHQMLHTTPESVHEKLPYESDSGLVITADARIDNRQELSEPLELDDNVDVSDSLFILRAYKKWGEKSPEKLLGDFAFTIWDENEEKLFCARDHMGVKPFYYYLSEDIFLFATEIKALLKFDEVPKRINELMIGYYLAIIERERELTFYEDILRLPAASILTVDSDKIRLNKYWSLNRKKQIRYDSAKEYENAFNDLFQESVRCRLRSKFPLGSELSGGLDSSSVSCVAERLLRKKNKNSLNTFSLIFEKLRQCDESDYINSVLENGKYKGHFSYGDQISPLTEIENFICLKDGPLFAPGFGIFSGLGHEMNRCGARVILSGVGGDDVVSYGTRFLTELLLKKELSKFLFELKKISKIQNKSHLQIFLMSVAPIVPKNLKKLYHVFSADSHYDVTEKLINDDFKESMNLDKYFKAKDSHRNLFNDILSSQEYHFQLLNSPVNQRELEELDVFAAKFSFEYRFPFFDRRLIEFCLALPPEQKINYGWDRVILRRALAGIIPKKIQWRKDKTDISPNLEYTMSKYGKKFIEKIFKNPDLIAKYVNTSFLTKIYIRYEGNSVNFLSYIFLRAIMLDIWLDNQLNNISG